MSAKSDFKNKNAVNLKLRVFLLVIAIIFLLVSLIFLSDWYIVIFFALAALAANYTVEGMRHVMCYKGQSAEPGNPERDPYADLDRYDSDCEE
ncbi:MAG: hypothetical protein II847_02710 [Ruminobacter sp.]|jgi:hypothetical protein|uniref:Uncharacterized protein n=1 Tax=Ruminobacter amylophilus TaxID=867 RepID=A0A662ZHS6_9GAMM|nr:MULTISPECIES: hypothetical protein [Ruminobacter]MBQ3775024.1 hypothetical protein [Ruminobacter sp.]SFP03328.1 hypothetical protein SAMN02910344_00235 [Ruminobacter amylophilus]